MSDQTFDKKIDDGLANLEATFDRVLESHAKLRGRVEELEAELASGEKQIADAISCLRAARERAYDWALDLGNAFCALDAGARRRPPARQRAAGGLPEGAGRGRLSLGFVGRG